VENELASELNLLHTTCSTVCFTAHCTPIDSIHLKARCSSSDPEAVKEVP